MREVHRRQFQLGQVPIEKIWINPKSRDDIPAVLKGLQYIWSDEKLRARLFALLDEHIVPETDRTVGRPGMELWQVLVLGVLKQGLGCDFDRLHDLANHHETIRAFLGHSDFGDRTRYEYQRVVDNVSLLTPELLSAVGQLVVESGHKVAKKKGLPQNLWAECRTGSPSSGPQRARVLAAVQARRSAPPPLRGAHGVDTGSAHARPGSCLTMTSSRRPHRRATTRPECRTCLDIGNGLVSRICG